MVKNGMLLPACSNETVLDRWIGDYLKRDEYIAATVSPGSLKLQKLLHEDSKMTISDEVLRDYHCDWSFNSLYNLPRSHDTDMLLIVLNSENYTCRNPSTRFLVLKWENGKAITDQSFTFKVALNGPCRCIVYGGKVTAIIDSHTSVTFKYEDIGGSSDIDLFLSETSEGSSYSSDDDYSVNDIEESGFLANDNEGALKGNFVKDSDSTMTLKGLVPLCENKVLLFKSTEDDPRLSWEILCFTEISGSLKISTRYPVTTGTSMLRDARLVDNVVWTGKDHQLICTDLDKTRNGTLSFLNISLECNRQNDRYKAICGRPLVTEKTTTEDRFDVTGDINGTEICLRPVLPTTDRIRFECCVNSYVIFLEVDEGGELSTSWYDCTLSPGLFHRFFLRPKKSTDHEGSLIFLRGNEVFDVLSSDFMKSSSSIAHIRLNLPYSCQSLRDSTGSRSYWRVSGLTGSNAQQTSVFIQVYRSSASALDLSDHSVAARIKGLVGSPEGIFAVSIRKGYSQGSLFYTIQDDRPVPIEVAGWDAQRATLCIFGDYQVTPHGVNQKKTLKATRRDAKKRRGTVLPPSNIKFAAATSTECLIANRPSTKYEIWKFRLEALPRFEMVQDLRMSRKNPAIKAIAIDTDGDYAIAYKWRIDICDGKTNEFYEPISINFDVVSMVYHRGILRVGGERGELHEFSRNTLERGRNFMNADVTLTKGISNCAAVCGEHIELRISSRDHKIGCGGEVETGAFVGDDHLVLLPEDSTNTFRLLRIGNHGNPFATIQMGLVPSIKVDVATSVIDPDRGAVLIMGGNTLYKLEPFNGGQIASKAYEWDADIPRLLIGASLARHNPDSLDLIIGLYQNLQSGELIFTVLPVDAPVDDGYTIRVKAGTSERIHRLERLDWDSEDNPRIRCWTSKSECMDLTIMRYNNGGRYTLGPPQKKTHDQLALPVTLNMAAKPSSYVPFYPAQCSYEYTADNAVGSTGLDNLNELKPSQLLYGEITGEIIAQIDADVKAERCCVSDLRKIRNAIRSGIPDCECCPLFDGSSLRRLFENESFLYREKVYRKARITRGRGERLREEFLRLYG